MFQFLTAIFRFSNEKDEKMETGKDEDNEVEYCTLSPAVIEEREKAPRFLEKSQKEKEKESMVIECEPFYDSVPAEDSDSECESFAQIFTLGLFVRSFFETFPLLDLVFRRCRSLDSSQPWFPTTERDPKQRQLRQHRLLY